MTTLDDIAARCDGDFFCGQCPDCLASPDPENSLHRHSVSETLDRGGAMEATCVGCGQRVWRQSYGSFVGDWLTEGSDRT